MRSLPRRCRTSFIGISIAGLAAGGAWRSAPVPDGPQRAAAGRSSLQLCTVVHNGTQLAPTGLNGTGTGRRR